MIGIVFMFLILVSIVTCILVITCRTNCNRCGADKRSVKNLASAKKCTMFAYLLFVVVFFVAAFILSYYNVFA